MTEADRRYSPPVVIDMIKEWMIGRPILEKVSTSYVERLNFNTRQNYCRLTRLTNAFSKKPEHHADVVSVDYFFHNFARPHGILRKATRTETTRAMASGITNRVWIREECPDPL